jgi:hypothetical protein
MLVLTIFTSPSVGVTIAFGSTHYFNAIQNVGRGKSFVDDLCMERGTVSMRVALVLRSAEVLPLFRDLCIPLGCRFLPPYPSLLEAPWANSPPPKLGSAPKRDSPHLPFTSCMACRRASGPRVPCSAKSTSGLAFLLLSWPTSPGYYCPIC